MRHTSFLLFVLVPAALAACGDDAVKPGSLNVKWVHPGPTATCESRHIATLEARAIKSGEVVKKATSTCPAADRKGSIPLDDLDPGTYRIEVEGFNVAQKGEYLGIIEKQSVAEGTTRDTADISLEQKPVFLNVSWKLPGGSLCAASGIAEVEVKVTYDANDNPKPGAEAQKVKCDSAVKDPRDSDKMLAGVVFTGLEPNDDVAIEVTGYDKEDEAIAYALVEELVFSAGDEVVKSVDLATCPGDPPSCN